MEKIKVLFIYRNKGLAKKFTEHFRINDYDVYEFYSEEIPEFRLSLFQKLENIIFRIFFNDKSQIHKIKERNFASHSKSELKKLKNNKITFDYCLVIRGDLVPEFVIQHARSISKKMVDFQLDGISVSSKILDFQKYFDDLYVFDENDVLKYSGYPLQHATNCFFEDEYQKSKNIDFLYIGVVSEKRKKSLINLANFLESLPQSYDCQFLLSQNPYRKEAPVAGITFLEESLSYDDCLKLSRNSKFVIDMKREEHQGLSLRFFESLVYKNKIITDNVTIKKYNFYHPNNIFITDFKNFDGLANFLELPYHEIDAEIVHQYNFKNWIKKILGIE